MTDVNECRITTHRCRLITRCISAPPGVRSGSAFRRCHSRSIRRGRIHLADMCLCRLGSSCVSDNSWEVGPPGRAVAGARSRAHPAHTENTLIRRAASREWRDGWAWPTNGRDYSHLVYVIACRPPVPPSGLGPPCTTVRPDDPTVAIRTGSSDAFLILRLSQPCMHYKRRISLSKARTKSDLFKIGGGQVQREICNK